MKKSEEQPSESDFVKREAKPEAEKEKESEQPKEKEQTEAEIVSDSTTSMATIGEIVRKANEEEKKAKAEIEKANAEAAKKKAEEEKKRKEAEELDRKLRDEHEIKKNEALGNEGMEYLQSLAEKHEDEKKKRAYLYE